MNKRICAAFIFGLGATLGLVWLLGGGQMPRLNVAHAAGPHHVAPGGNCGTASPCYATIQAAVDAADPGDTIKVAQGDYTDIHIRGGITQVVYISKTVIIHGGYTTTTWAYNPISYPTTLNARGLGRVLVITGSITPTIEGLRITGGDATGLGGWKGDPANHDAGGGVYVYGATPTISRCVIYSNTASTLDFGFGGGLYLEGVTALTGNTVQENIASTAYNGVGGGMYLRYSDGSTLSGNTILTNTASTTNTGSGGGVYLYWSDTALVDNTLQGNVGSQATSDWGHGGGLYAYLSDVTLVGNTVRGNVGGATYSAYGGGVYLRGAEATLESNWIIDNAASQAAGYTGLGGGVYVYQTSPITLINNVVADNYAYSNGSGLYMDGESAHAVTARFLHNTIADNRSSSGGLYLADYTTAFMTNTILAGHTNAALRVEASSTATLEATLWHGNGSLTYGDGAIISSTNVYSAPGFVDPSTWDYHLAADSAAIDAGVDASVPDDIDGDQRPVDGDLDGTAAMDIGADEVLVPVITLAKSAPAWFNLGTYITYTLRVTNTGLVTGYSVILTDTLPAGGSFAWASDGGVEASDVVTWPAFSVPPNGGVVTRTFAVTATDTITNVKYEANAQGVPAVGGTVAVRTFLNHPPAADAGAFQAGAPGATVTLSGSGSSDPDSHTLTYLWQQTGGEPQVLLTDARAPATTFTAPDDPTVLTFTLTVTDTCGLHDSDTTTVTVAEHKIYLPLVLRSFQ